MTKMTLGRILRRGALFMALGTVGGSSAALASSHREAPAISSDPQADNTDLWAWVDPTTHATLHVVASYNPMEEPSGGPNFYKFSDDVLYQLHVARGDGQLADAVTYNVRFTTAPITHVALPTAAGPTVGGGQEFFAQLAGSFAQTYTVTKVVGQTSTVIASNVPVAPPRIGPRTDAVINATADAGYNDEFAAGFVTQMGTTGSEGAVWAGPRDDGFYVDLGGVFDLANLRPAGTAQDGLAGFNCHTIAFDIPTKLLTFDGNAPAAGASDKNTLGIWASASRPKVNILRNDGTHTGVGPWVQVSRIGLPLINEAVIGLQDKDKYNRTTPVTDVANFAAYFEDPVIVKDAEAVGIYAALGVPSATVTAEEGPGRTDIITVINLTNFGGTGTHQIPIAAGTTGDVLRVDLGVDSQFPNGRSIPGGATANAEQVNVTDVELSLLLTGATSGVSNNVAHNDAAYLAAIPYLALPWRGYDQGHGKVPSP